MSESVVIAIAVITIIIGLAILVATTIYFICSFAALLYKRIKDWYTLRRMTPEEVVASLDRLLGAGLIESVDESDNPIE